jgi:hypothetical protein
VRVTVAAPYQVCHAGTAYRPGETADVPDAVADAWIHRGWVTPAPEEDRAERDSPAPAEDKPRRTRTARRK